MSTIGNNANKVILATKKKVTIKHLEKNNKKIELDIWIKGVGNDM